MTRNCGHTNIAKKQKPSNGRYAIAAWVSEETYEKCWHIREKRNASFKWLITVWIDNEYAKLMKSDKAVCLAQCSEISQSEVPK